MDVAMLLSVGIISGIISAMGMGGGTVLILILGFVMEIDQIALQGINLFYFIPIAIISIILHLKNKKIEIKTTAVIIPFGVIGAILGAITANYLIGAVYLKKTFGIFVLIIGIYTLLSGFNWNSLKNLNNPAK